MHCNEIIPGLAFNNRMAKPEPSGQDWLPFLSFSTTWANKSPAESTGPVRTDRRVNVDLDQLIQEVASLYQITRIAYEHSRNLQAIIRPFLSRTTWTEAAEVARRGRQALPTETREVSILWLDIANFTELMNSHPLDQVLTDLDAYLDLLTRLVYRHHGDVNKYLGDGFLSIFSNADDAVQSGCAIQQAAADFNSDQSARGGLVFPTRIGIDSGPVIITSLGSPDRQDRTVMGMPVNLAERLQACATPGRVWLSQATFDQMRNRSGCCYLGPVQVKGRQEPVIVYEKRY